MTTQASDLTGKVALVTGGGRGIGRAIALGLADAGADVGVTARTQGEIDAVAEEIRVKSRKGASFQTDVTDRDQVDALSSAFTDEFGLLDILINNAGGGSERKTVLESDPDLWRASVELNLFSAYLVKYLLIYWKK